MRDLIIHSEDRTMYEDMLRSGVVWLGRLGELREAVLAEDWERARKLAAPRITYPEPWPRLPSDRG